MTPESATSLSIARDGLQFVLDPGPCRIVVQHGVAAWPMQGAGLAGVAHLSTTDGAIYVLGGSDATAGRRLVPLQWRRVNAHEIEGTGHLPELAVDCRLTYAVEKHQRLRCDLEFAGADVARIATVRFPFAPAVSGPDARLVFPQWLGLLVPAQGADLRVARHLWERPWCMRFFGATQPTAQGERSYIAIVEDSLYRGVDVWREAGRAGYDLLGEPSWDERQATSRQRRQTVTFAFLEGDYVAVAHHYRAWMQKRPEWETLASRRRACRPDRVAGAILFAHVPCDYGGEVTPFDTLAGRLDGLRAAGIERALFHIGGWNRLGYDSEYPDILPANPKCGGDDGMRRLTAAIDAAGYLCAPHDDVGIISTRAPSYDEKWVARGSDGKPIAGGTYREQQYYITSGAAQAHFARRNLPDVARRYPDLHGYLFDVTTSVIPLEDHSRTPPYSKAEDLSGRCDLFRTARREFAELTFAESIMDWAIADLDAAFMAEEGYRHQGNGGWSQDALDGEIVPIWELVYHDVLLAVRESTTHVNTPMDTTDPLVRYLRIYLKTLRAGALPPSFYSDDLTLSILGSYIAASTTPCGGWSSLDKVRLIAAVSRLSVWLGDLVFHAPMSAHAFPDRNLFHERTVFASPGGPTVVTVNTDGAEAWSPEPGLTLAPLGFHIAGPGLLAYHALEVGGVRLPAAALVAVRRAQRGSFRAGATVEAFRAFGPVAVPVPGAGGTLLASIEVAGKTYPVVLKPPPQ
jgi:hypothetical protein